MLRFNLSNTLAKLFPDFMPGCMGCAMSLDFDQKQTKWKNGAYKTAHFPKIMSNLTHRIALLVLDKVACLLGLQSNCEWGQFMAESNKQSLFLIFSFSILLIDVKAVWDFLTMYLSHTIFIFSLALSVSGECDRQNGLMSLFHNLTHDCTKRDTRPLGSSRSGTTVIAGSAHVTHYLSVCYMSKGTEQ